MHFDNQVCKECIYFDLMEPVCVYSYFIRESEESEVLVCTSFIQKESKDRHN